MEGPMTLPHSEHHRGTRPFSEAAVYGARFLSVQARTNLLSIWKCGRGRARAP